MSYSTTPAYIESVKGWEDRLEEHPVWSWMHSYEKEFDYGNMTSGPHTPWHTDDFTFVKAAGETFQSGEASWAALCEMYKPFSAHFHEPFQVIIWETSTGYELFGAAKI